MKKEYTQMLGGPVALSPDNFTDHLWGGDWIPRFKGLKPTPGTTVGESWEFSTLPERPSKLLLSSGQTMGLREFIQSDPKGVLGERVVKKFGPNSPLLLKFIDAHDDLSIQVHPSDDFALEQEKSVGKSEAWLILEVGRAEGEGFIYLGFNPNKVSDYPDLGAFEEAFYNALTQANAQGPSTDWRVRDKSARLVLPFLNKIPVKPGEIYEIKPGIIHALGKGVRLFEIQQASDLTYRVWDWNRPDAKKLKEGKLEFRPLHLEKSKQVLNFQPAPPESFLAKGDGLMVIDQENKFAASLIRLKPGQAEMVKTNGVFAVLTAIKGSVLFGTGEKLEKGHSVLLPASLESVQITADTTETEIIKSYVPAASHL